MFKRNLLIFFCLFSFLSFGQSRIGLDISSRYRGFNITFNYHKLVKNRIILTAGLFAGGNGYAGFSLNDIHQSLDGISTKTPFSTISPTYSDTSGFYPDLKGYETITAFYGLSFGAGTYFTLNENNSIRTSVLAKFGRGTSNIKTDYRSSTQKRTQTVVSNHNYWVSALSLEAFHVIRISTKFTLYYGLKVPYYLLIDKKNFNPQRTVDAHYGFEPEMSAGVTYFIGKESKED